ncbi:TPA: hypothetical protein HA333_11905 [Pyrobaculum aerophilum]|nr:hypothetical protein [Pyrobaculum aerophilum]
MNALQVAVSMAFVGILSVIIAWIVNTQAQIVFEEEAKAAAEALLASVVNQLRVGASTASISGVYSFTQQISLPYYSPPFDAFYYAITIRNEQGVLVVYISFEAYRGRASAYVDISKAVYNISALYKPEGYVQIYADLGESYNCRVGDVVNLTRAGCYVKWAMPSPYTVRKVQFIVGS